MQPFIVRSVSLEDAEAIAECHKEAVEKKAAAFYGADVIDEWSRSPNRIERIRGEIKNQDFIYLVACLGDSIVGYGIANPSAFELKSLCARSNEKGRVGTSLLAALIDQCKKQNCAYLELSSSLNAERFYLDNGFRVLERSQHRLDSGVEMNCVRMRIELNS
jgi:L-amino acid N-acyltransferase YncA